MPHFHNAIMGGFGSVLLTVIIFFAASLYLCGWVSLPSNSLDRIPAWRGCSFLVGLFLIWVAVASPLSALDHELLTVHMLKHLLLMTLAPPLIWLGEPMRPVLRGLPRRFVRRVLAPALQLMAVHGIGRALGRPEFTWLGAAAVLVGWHIPAVFTLAMQSTAWHLVEQSSFLAGGLLFWWPVVQPGPSVLRPGLSMILYLFLGTLPCDILSGFLVFCDRVVYPGYFSSPHRFGFSALGDQQCAAALMWTCVTLVYLTAGAILTMRLLSTRNSRDDGFVQPNLHVKAAPRGLQQNLEVF